QRPAPAPSTRPPDDSDSRARWCDGVSSECSGSKSAGGSAQGFSGAWTRMSSGIAQEASASCQRLVAVAELNLANRVNQVAPEHQGALRLEGVGEPIEFLELWIRIVLRVLGHAGNLDDDDVLGDLEPCITAELRPETARAQELPAGLVVTAP